MTTVIAELTALDEHHEAADLITKIWHRELLEPGLIRTIAHVGGYVAGARRGGELVGVSVGFFAGDGHLHSHITGVLPGARGGLGQALKEHQRAWALARGVSAVSWTFDPLVSRNAYLNFHKLGARAAAYLPDFYGTMRDAINAGEDTDRLYVVWDLGAPARERPERGLDGAVVLLGRDGDEPVRTSPAPRAGARLAVAMPPDVERLRELAPATAGRWRRAVREALIRSGETGHTIVDVTRDGWYVLGDET
ncbi:GNAT family N-acetyltransferase [Nonomuraea phyllanthi]|uniref:GNAT family N-acetyltransferase n=1 Tax=Nonomuraea phyllanthi TaxID=2219224 RepID=UPI0012935DFB|nr:GNAT family N-acetyltransferase [Nonomuraea phyllanthi]QFY08922.1 GNAT family N-acetyltransferase [Nonomuraea phyllanthi]